MAAMIRVAPVVGGSFGVAGGQGPELLEPGEAAFDDVAPGVDVWVEGPWASAGGALGLAVGDLVGAFGAGEGDAAGAQRRPGGGVGVGLVDHHPVRAPPGTAGPTRATETSSSSGNSCGLSPACPAVSRMA